MIVLEISLLIGLLFVLGLVSILHILSHYIEKLTPRFVGMNEDTSSGNGLFFIVEGILACTIVYMFQQAFIF